MPTGTGIRIRLLVVPSASALTGLRSAVAPLNTLVTDKFQCNVCQENCTADPYVVPECLHSYCCDCVKECLRMFGNECPACLVNGGTTSKRDLCQDTQIETRPPKTNKRDRCNDSSEDTSEDSCINDHAEAEAFNNTCADELEASTVKSCCDDRRVKKIKYSGSKFDLRVDELREYKNKFGHCNVPSKYAENRALGNWSSNLRTAYSQIQRGRKPIIKLSSERIELLEKIGFKWKFKPPAGNMKTMDIEPSPSLALPAQRSHSEKGVNRESDEESDGDSDEESDKNDWEEPEANRRSERMKKRARCDHDEKDFHLDSLVKGVDSSDEECSEVEDAAVPCDNERRVEKRKVVTFDERVEELTDFKDRFGHCFVPRRYPENVSLGHWCNNLRHAYKLLQNGQKSSVNLSKERFERMEKLGFKWEIQNES